MAEIPSPILDVRNEERIAAMMIARVTGPLSVEFLEKDLATTRELIAKMQGGAVGSAICPELTNANASSPHVKLFMTYAWVVAQIARRINQLPERDAIEFHKLFGIELRDATAATTTLRFTVAPPPDTPVIIPEGTEVGTGSNNYVFRTTAELLIPAGDVTGDVAAERTETGPTLLAPNQLINLLDEIAFVTAVTNPQAIDSGRNQETVNEALARARSYQRRGERIVSARDLEEAILYEVLDGVGIVKAFPLVAAGEGDDPDWQTMRAGHTTVIVMTPSGLPVSEEKKAAIRSLFSQVVGNQFIYVRDPAYHDFNVTANIITDGLTEQLGVIAAVKANLQSIYSVREGNFGRPILRSDIITLIESTQGVVRIVSDAAGPILAAPVVDIALAPYELPRINEATINPV
jgi:hypothetical protein